MQVAGIFPDIVIPSEEVIFFDNHVIHRSIAEKEYFTKSYRTGNDIAFVDTGSLQTFIANGRKKHVIGTSRKNEFVTVFASLSEEENSHWVIQALEPTHITLISDQLLFQLCQRHHCWLQFWLRILGHKTTHLIEKEKQLLKRKHS